MKIFPKTSIFTLACVCAIGFTSCETVRDSVQKRRDAREKIELPSEFIMRNLATAKQPDDTPINPNDINEERGTDIDKSVDRDIPIREIKITHAKPEEDYPITLMKKVKDKDEKMKVELVSDALPLVDIVELFRDHLGFDYIIDPALSAKTVTISINEDLSATEVWGMFEHILWLSGAYATRNQGYIDIMPFAKMPQEQRIWAKHTPVANVDVSLITCTKVAANDILTNIKPFITVGASITVLPKLNAFLIVETPSNMNKVRELITMLDRNWRSEWPVKAIRCKDVDTETIKEDLMKVLQTMGIPASFDTLDESVAVSITDVPRMQIFLVSSPQLELINEVAKWINVLDTADLNETPQVYFYNVKYSEMEDLREAMDTFFNTEGSATAKSSSKKKSSISTKGVETKAATKTKTTKIKNSANNRSRSSKSDDELTNTAFDESVVLWEDLQRNRLVMQTTARGWALAQALLERLDSPIPQVLIQVTIVDIVLSNNLEYGFRYAVNEQQNGNWSGSGQSGGTPTGTFPYDTGLGLLFETENWAIDFIASVAGRTNSKIISAPQIVVLSDKEAELDVSTEKSIVTSVDYDSNNNPRNNYDYKKAGVILTILPHITASNQVMLEITQTVDNFMEGEDLDEGQAPTIQSRIINSTLVIPDGRTLLLGGMIRNQDTTIESGFPLLMDIPYLGELFKYTSNATERTELLVLVTATVVDDKTKLELLLDRYKESVKEISRIFADSEEEVENIVNNAKEPIIGPKAKANLEKNSEPYLDATEKKKPSLETAPTSRGGE